MVHKDEHTRKRSSAERAATPGKDRPGHEAKRGVKMNPEALINEVPTEAYLKDMRPSVLAESDRGVAIMYSAMVEQALKSALCHKLSHLSETELYDWFGGPTAPFCSFSAKIKLGRGLQIYDESVEKKLNLIRKIRNVFAHRALPLDFEHGGLKPLRDALLDDLGTWPLTTKEVFAGYCLAVTITLRSLDKGEIVTA